MADPIVQTIKVQVEGADQAAAEIKKVGQATEEVQQTAASTGGGTEKLGQGLDQVSGKAGITGREMKALGKVMKEFGAGELAGTAIGFYKLATALGPLGVALFAAGEAFSFVKGKMKEAEEAAKAVTQEFANITKINAEMNLDDTAKFWGTTSEAMKKAANDAGQVAAQITNIKNGIKEAIDPLTSQDTLTKAFIKNMQAASIPVNDVMADTKKLGEASKQAALLAAQIYQNMSPIERLNFENVLKGLGFPEDVIASIKKGSAAVKQLQDEATASSFDNWRPGLEKLGVSVGVLKNTLNQTGAAGNQAAQTAFKGFKTWDDLVKDVTVNSKGFKQEVETPIKPQVDTSQATSTFDAFIQKVTSWVTTAPGNAWQWIKDTFNEAVGWVGTKIDEANAFINAWVTTPVANAWQWIKDVWNDLGTWIGAKIEEAKALVTAWVTTPVANAWQWIVDKWNAMKALLGFGGGGTPAPAGGGASGNASGGLIGGRGTGTSDSNLSWVSRGEHIMPAHAVAQPGVLAFLEGLRRSGGNLRAVLDGMGRFALGGLVRAPLSIPAFAGGGMNHVTINFPGLPEITGLRASSGVVDELRKAAALSQVRSGGRKPSRYS